VIPSSATYNNYVIPLASKAGQLMGAKASSGRMLALYSSKTIGHLKRCGTLTESALFFKKLYVGRGI